MSRRRCSDQARAGQMLLLTEHYLVVMPDIFAVEELPPDVESPPRLPQRLRVIALQDVEKVALRDHRIVVSCRQRDRVAAGADFKTDSSRVCSLQQRVCGAAESNVGTRLVSVDYHVSEARAEAAAMFVKSAEDALVSNVILSLVQAPGEGIMQARALAKPMCVPGLFD